MRAVPGVRVGDAREPVVHIQAFSLGIFIEFADECVDNDE